VKNFGKNVSPLTSLLKNNAFFYSVVIEHSFSALKDSMCTTPVLEIPYFTKSFVLECEASSKGLGVELM
jgi:hypothetical protein